MTDLAGNEPHANGRSAIKRPRPVISCLECRRKKLKCDRLLPCQQCVKGGRPSICKYSEGQEPELRRAAEIVDSPPKRQRAGGFYSIANGGSSKEIEDLHARVQNLEQALQWQNGHSASTPSQIRPKELQQSPHLELESASRRDPSSGIDPGGLRRPILHHFEAADDFVNRLSQRSDHEELKTIATHLRAINKATTPRRSGIKSSYNNIDDVVAHLIRLLPSMDVCSKMIAVYFRNFEACARVLHKPTILAQFQAFDRGALKKNDRNWFVPVLALVVSIASSLDTLEECDIPQLHRDDNEVGVFQLIQNWLDLLSPSQKHTVSALQIRLLSLKPQKSRILPALELWLANGLTMRYAMALRLHEEPPKHLSVLQAEIRRRLWVTVIEQDLFFSIECGMPCTCPALAVRPPLSVNDEELTDDLNEPIPSSWPNTQWTDGLCQHVLAQSFNDRLHAYALVSSSDSGVVAPYREVLIHTKRLEDIIHALPQVFRVHHITDEISNTPGRLLAKMELDFYLRRPLNACYTPFGRVMPLDDRYKQARLPWVQSCLYSVCFQDLFDPKYPMLEIPRAEGLWDFFYNIYNWDMQQAMLAMCLELKRRRRVAEVEVAGHAAVQQQEEGQTIQGLVKSCEDTLDPFVRTVGRRTGVSLVDAVRWTIVFETLRWTMTGVACKTNDTVKFELQKLVATLKRKLHGEGIRVLNPVVDGVGGQGDGGDNGGDDIEWLIERLRADSENDANTEGITDNITVNFGASFLG